MALKVTALPSSCSTTPVRYWRNSAAPPFVHAFHAFTPPALLRRAPPSQTSCVARRQWDASWPDDHGGASSAAAGQAQGAPRLLAVNCSLQHQPSRARPRLLTQDPSRPSWVSPCRKPACPRCTHPHPQRRLELRTAPAKSEKTLSISGRQAYMNGQAFLDIRANCTTARGSASEKACKKDSTHHIKQQIASR